MLGMPPTVCFGNGGHNPAFSLDVWIRDMGVLFIADKPNRCHRGIVYTKDIALDKGEYVLGQKKEDQISSGIQPVYRVPPQTHTHTQPSREPTRLPISTEMAQASLSIL